MERSCFLSGQVLTASLLLAGLFGFSHPGLADEKSTGTKGEKVEAAAAAKSPVKSEKVAAKKAAAAVPAISAEREAAAMEFAQQNHPELVSLLQGLKQNAPKEYQAALVDLDRTADRLMKLKDKVPERYEQQLTEWKFTSRIRLLAARLAMSEDPAVESELRATLRERLEFRLTAQRIERDRLQKRVDKLDQTIGELSSKTDATIEKQLAEIRTAMSSTKSVPKNKPKRPAAATSEDAKGDK